jgi:hypothetical protein
MNGSNVSLKIGHRVSYDPTREAGMPAANGWLVRNEKRLISLTGTQVLAGTKARRSYRAWLSS